MSLPLRTLDRDAAVSAIGVGFGSIAGFYGPPGALDERVAVLKHAHATGLRFWDMADIYGDSEYVVREWIKRSGKRNDVFLATKFGLHRQTNGRHTFRSDPEYVKASCARSLQRLGVDTIDLYYCHRVDGVTPIERTVEAMEELNISDGDLRRMYPKYAEENFPEILKLVEKLKNVADGHGSTPAKVALAWLLATGPDILPIPGTKSAARMDENAAAALMQLSDREVQEIRTLAEKVEIEGTSTLLR